MTDFRHCDCIGILSYVFRANRSLVQTACCLVLTTLQCYTFVSALSIRLHAVASQMPALIAHVNALYRFSFELWNYETNFPVCVSFDSVVDHSFSLPLVVVVTSVTLSFCTSRGLFDQSKYASWIRLVALQASQPVESACHFLYSETYRKCRALNRTEPGTVDLGPFAAGCCILAMWHIAWPWNEETGMEEGMWSRLWLVFLMQNARLNALAEWQALTTAVTSVYSLPPQPVRAIDVWRFH